MKSNMQLYTSNLPAAALHEQTLSAITVCKKLNSSTLSATPWALQIQNGQQSWDMDEYVEASTFTWTL